MSLRRSLLAIFALLAVSPAALAQTQPICDVTCGPDPSSPTYSGTFAARPKSKNVRGTATVLAPRAAVASSASVSSTALPGSESYSYAIPIVNLPGRNGLDVNLTLFYNSAVWTIDTFNGTATFNADRDFPSYGFHLGYGMIEAPPSGDTSFLLTEPDGSKRELRFVSGTTYVTEDSSYIDWNSSTMILRRKDGTQWSYQQVSGATSFYRPFKILDTNGNFITIVYSGVSGAPKLAIATITDTVNRTITFNYDANNRLTSITAPIFGGTTATVASFGWSQEALNYNFTGFTITDSPTSGSTVNILTSCAYVNGTGYSFLYGDWGIVTKISRLSANSTVRSYQRYDYPTAASALSDHPAYQHQFVSADGSTETSWTYAVTKSGGVTSTFAITDPANTTATTNLFTSGWQTGLPSSVTFASGATTSRTISNNWTQDDTSQSVPVNPRILSTSTTLNDSGQVSSVSYGYGSNGNITSVTENAFGNGSAGGVVRTTVTSYLIDSSSGPSYANLHILDRPSQVLLKDAVGNVIARTDLAYDAGTLTNITAAPQHDNTNYGSGFTTRGNLTGTTRYTNAAAGTGPIPRSFTYDSLGNLLTAQVDCCQSKQWNFSSSTNFAYPDSLTRGTGTTQLTTSATYDLGTGLVLTQTDENNQVLHYLYDALKRSTSVTGPLSLSATYSYDDNAAQPARTQTTAVDTGKNVIQIVTTDGLGRLVKQQTQDGAGANASVLETQYNSSGRVSQVSNPHGTSESALWTQNQYDALGRVVKVIPPDGSASANNTQIAYSGNSTTVTDPAGKQRRTITDALGRLIEADEPGVVPPQNNHATMQTDGNFVVYNQGGTALWSTGTAGTTDGPMELQDDGNLVLYLFKWQAGVFAASSPGPFPPQTCSIGIALNSPQTLPSGSCITSPLGQYMLYMNTDGNLFIYDIAHATATWSTGTFGNPGAYANMQTDGNFVVYSTGGVALWSSGTSGTFSERLEMEDDGLIVIFKSAWNSGTSQGWGSSSFSHPGCDVGASVGTTGTVGTGQCLVSPNGKYELLLQTDGNLVLYDRSVTPLIYLWSAGTALSPFDPTVGQQTTYAYDVMDNLTGATQGVQSRAFSYDSLGNLLSAATPEAGTVTNAYNSFNLVSTRTDNRGVITSYSYDTLNRLTQVSYNVGTTGVPATSTVTLAYGTSASSNNKGRLTSMTDGTGSEAYTYNALGRVTALTKTIGTKAYPLSYAYDIVGSLKSVTYPSGRVVTQGFDTLERLQQVSSSGTNYVSGIGYNSAWEPTSFNYGNGVAASFGYNSRMQLASLAYTKGSSTLFSLSYGYTQNGGNNGQITSITDNVDNGRTANYSYDVLSRLATAQTTGSANYPAWGISWSYDRYGNRLAETVTAGSGPSNSVSVDATTNRINTAGYAYDAGGNMTNDGLNTMTYNAENRVVTSISGGVTSTYSYDGNGLRVKKQVGSATATVYIFSSSKVIAEYASGAKVNSPTKEYIYSGSALLATISGNTTNYHMGDQLSPRLTTNTSGTVAGQQGHFPFGESWYSSNTTTKFQFTSYERDSESGNDYAIARSYVNRLARFSSPDPLGGFIDNPQSLNRYPYALNNPINLVDPSGLSCITVNYIDPDTGEEVSQLADDGDGLGCAGAGVDPTPKGADPSPSEIQPDKERVSGTPDTFDPPPDEQSFLDCVKNGGDYLSLQNGLRSVTGDRLGNGWVSGALLGNTFSGAIQLGQDLKNGNIFGAGNNAAQVMAPSAATPAAKQVPNVVFSASAAATVSLQTPRLSATATFAAKIKALIPLGTAAVKIATKLDNFGNLLHLPVDLTGTSFSVVVCSIGR
jgi:RHS repeat-associated protein